jgi:dinuclear metal center YbgI/SA1388 family protein
MKRDELVAWLDKYLKVNEIKDLSHNGLQVESPDEISRVAFAVDGTIASFEKAVACKAGLLVVHHGLLWKEPVKLTGPHFKRIETLIKGNCGLYASHLPLDLHGEVGNNAQIAKLLELGDIVPFGDYHGVMIGCGGSLKTPELLESLVDKLRTSSGSEPLRVFPFGPNLASRVAIVSGGAPEFAESAAREGYDTYITGDAQHQFVHTAHEYGINLVFGGHYATETFGVKALEQKVRDIFKLDTVFLDLPTGL